MQREIKDKRNNALNKESLISETGMRESKENNRERREEGKIGRTHAFYRKENCGEVTLIAVSIRTYGKRSSYLAFP